MFNATPKNTNDYYQNVKCRNKRKNKTKRVIKVEETKKEGRGTLPPMFGLRSSMLLNIIIIN